MTGRLLSTSGLVIAAVLFFAVNIIADGVFRMARLDLTEDRLFTLSDGTRNVLASIEEPITLRFFFSAKLARQLPQFNTYGNRIRDLLEVYADIAGDRLRLEVIDPEPFSEAEDRAVSFGLTGAPINNAGDLFYLGLVGTNSTDDQETIAFFQPDREQFLEYDLTKLIYSLNNPEKPVVAVISSLPLEFGPGGLQAAMRGQSRPYGIMSAMRQFFDVRVLREDATEIDSDVDIVLLVHPRGLSDRLRYAVDQFVLGGGRAMVFVDPYAETAAGLPPAPGMPPDPSASQASELSELLAAWGVDFDPTHFVADRGNATRVNTGQTGRAQVVDYVVWISLQGEGINRDDVAGGELDNLLLASAGSLKKRADADVTFTPLITSSADSALVEADRLGFNTDPAELLAAFEADEDRYVLAARVTGRFASAFDGPPADTADGEDAASADDDEKPAHLERAAAPVSLIVVADADMLDDRFWLQRQNLFGQELLIPTTSNADFLVNGLDNLAGSGDLISLRSRSRSNRPFVVFDKIRREAEQQFLARERALQEKLEEAEQKIAELQSKAGESGGAILSREEMQAIENFRAEQVKTRKELRAVQHDLRKDIEAWQSGLRLLNIGLVPMTVFVLALVMGWLRYRRRGVGGRLRQA